MSTIKCTENGFSYSTRDERLLIESYGKNCIRVRATKNGSFSDERHTLLAAGESSPTTEITDEKSILKNGLLRVEIHDIAWGGSYRMEFYKNDKLILATHNEGDAASRFEHTEGDHYRTRMIFDAFDDEHIYGLGQEQHDFFDKKGCTFDLRHWNTKSTLPVIYSSLGYGFIWNNPGTGRVEFANNHTVWTADSCYQSDFLIFTGDSPAEIMHTYCELTGFAPMLPEWAAGFWQSRLRYESRDEVLDVARKYRALGVPLSAIVIDYFHWTEQGEWQFEPSLWQDPKGMVDELREMGTETVVSIWPTINPNSRNWQIMNEENMLVRTENGRYGIFDFYGEQTYVDVTNPDARDYMWQQAKKGYYDYGIRCFWLDEAEPEVRPQQFSNLKFHIGNGAQKALLYPYYYSKAFYDGLKSEGEDDIVLLTRAAYPGSQTLGAAVWNGDIISTFESLKNSVVSGLSMAVCGIPWWNSDIGGFHSGDTESEYFRELIVRWFQFGLFCPIMRLHGVRLKPKDHKPKHEGIKEPSGGDNEIWSFGERSYDILKELILLRERLKPYILRCFKNTSETGEPIMRPMFFDFPEDKKCFELKDQYMFGRDILFAPIVEQGQTSREVYLPDGKWIRTTDRSIHDGGNTVVCGAELNEFIAFVREGAEVIEAF